MRLRSRCSLPNSRPIDLASASAPNSIGTFTPLNEPMFTSPSSGLSLNGNHSSLDGLNASSALKPVFIPTLLGLENFASDYHGHLLFHIKHTLRQYIWQITVPKDGMSHDFILHALIAIAAVSLMYLTPRKRHLYERAAANHRNLALSMSIPAFNEVNSKISAHFCTLVHNFRIGFCIPPSRTACIAIYSCGWHLKCLYTYTRCQNGPTKRTGTDCSGALGVFIGHTWDPTISPLPED